MSGALPGPIGLREAWAAPIYFGAYLAYLFWNPESELQHWLTLVLVPLLVAVALRNRGERRLPPLLASFGLRRGNITRGVGWAVLLGLAISVFQLWGSRYAEPVLELMRSGRALLLFPIALLAMMVTAGFTEEFFFRGFLQTRLQRLTRSKPVAVLVAAVLFGVYHLPYAYLNPNWPSAGDWSAAWLSALGQGGVGGLILGALYIATRHNLLACVVLHSMINALPAMTMIRFGA